MSTRQIQRDRRGSKRERQGSDALQLHEDDDDDGGFEEKKGTT